MGFDTAMEVEEKEEETMALYYQEHLESVALRDGLMKGELVKGVMRIREHCH